MQRGQKSYVLYEQRWLFRQQLWGKLVSMQERLLHFGDRILSIPKSNDVCFIRPIYITAHLLSSFFTLTNQFPSVSVE